MRMVNYWKITIFWKTLSMRYWMYKSLTVLDWNTAFSTFQPVGLYQHIHLVSDLCWTHSFEVNITIENFKTYIFFIILIGVRLTPLRTADTIGLLCRLCQPQMTWWWLWSNWWNKDWQGKLKYTEKTCHSAIKTYNM
jgi:hypothetical protein